MEVAGSGITTYQAYDEAVAAATSDWLHTQSASETVAQRRPFAVVAGFVLPHCPFFAPKELFDYYYDKVNVPALESDTDQPHPIRRWRANRDMIEPLTERQVRVARAAYLGLCEHLDHQIGKVLDALQESGLAKNTLVVYCSDHGEVAGESECITQPHHSRCPRLRPFFLNRHFVSWHVHTHEMLFEQNQEYGGSRLTMKHLWECR